MKKPISIMPAAALTAAVVMLNGTSAASTQQTLQYEVGGFPITPLQLLALQPTAQIKEQQRLSRQPTMDASRHAAGQNLPGQVVQFPQHGFQVTRPAS